MGNDTPAVDPILLDEATRHIDDPDWAITATASKVPAMLRLSQYDSEKSIWLKMFYPDRFPRKSSKSARRGSSLEAGYLDMWFEDHPEYERVNGGEVTYTRNNLGYLAAATPDDVARDRDTGFLYAIECKTVGPYAKILKEFGAEWTDQVPMKYFVQGVWQNFVGNFAGVLLIKNGPLIDDQETFRIGRNAQVEAQLEARVAAFMSSLRAGIEPENDERAETYDAIRLAYWELFDDKDPDANWEVNIDLAIEYHEALRGVDSAEGRLTKAKSDLLTVMGKARRAVVPGPVRISEKTGKELKPRPLTIANRQRKGEGVSLVRPKTEVELDYLYELRAAAAVAEGAA